MNEVYSICINRNLILSRGLSSFFFPPHSPRCLTSSVGSSFSFSFFSFSLCLLSLRSTHPLLRFFELSGLFLLPSGEIYKAVEWRVPLKSRQSVDFCRGTELETLLSLSLPPSLFVVFFLSVAR